MENFTRKLKLSLFSKNGCKIWGFSIFIILLILFYSFNNKIDEKILNKLVSSDMLNISGVLAGFIFTGLGMIITSNSKLVVEFRETNNFSVIRDYYSGTISCFLLTILLYLFKEVIANSISNVFFIKLYLFVTLDIFILAIIFFAISLIILNEIIND